MRILENLKSVMSLTACWCSGDFSDVIGSNVNECDFFYVIYEMCQHLEVLHNSVNQYFPYDSEWSYKIKHSEIHANPKIDQWILIQHSIKSLWLWFQIPHFNWHLRNYSLLSFGMVSEKNTHNYLKRLLK